MDRRGFFWRLVAALAAPFVAIPHTPTYHLADGIDVIWHLEVGEWAS
jgi:hypothetical protein